MATVFDVTKYILHKCGKMSTWKLQKLCYYSQAWHLRELSHSEAPWKDARNGLPDGAKCRTVITKESMGEYYGSL